MWRAASQVVVRCTLLGVPKASPKAFVNWSPIRYLPWPHCSTSLLGLSALIFLSRSATVANASSQVISTHRGSWSMPFAGLVRLSGFLRR